MNQEQVELKAKTYALIDFLISNGYDKQQIIKNLKEANLPITDDVLKRIDTAT